MRDRHGPRLSFLTHNEWFLEQVEDAMREADNTATEWIPHAVVKQDMARQRAELLARIECERDCA